MVDNINLVTILPPQPVQNIQQGFTSQSANTQNIVPSLPVGSTLDGFIVNRDNNGNPVLRTNTGDYTFSSNYFLKIGSEVSLRIENIAGNTTAQIIRVDGQSPQVAQQQSAFAGEPDVILSPQFVAATGNAQTPANIANSASAAVALQASLAAGLSSKVTGTLISNPVVPVAGAQLPVGTEVTLNIQSVALPAGNVSTVIAQAIAQNGVNLNSGKRITATVIGNDASGEALIHTDAGVVRLAPGSGLPAGSTITFEVVDTSLPASGSISGNTLLNPTASSITQLAQRWLSLEQLYSELGGLQTDTGLDGALSTQLQILGAQQNLLPSSTISPQTISAGLFAFIAALRGGNLSDWLGAPAVKTLQERGRKELLDKLEGDFKILSHLYNSPQTSQSQSSNWQSLFFPVAVDGQVQQVRMFVKRDKDHENEDSDAQGGSDNTRFVIEIDLSALGEMQLDGFVKKTGKELHFDMKIRSLQPLASDLQQEITQIFNNAATATGFSGVLSFQAVKSFPINPMNEIIDDINSITA